MAVKSLSFLKKQETYSVPDGKQMLIKAIGTDSNVVSRLYVRDEHHNCLVVTLSKKIPQVQVGLLVRGEQITFSKVGTGRIFVLFQLVDRVEARDVEFAFDTSSGEDMRESLSDSYDERDELVQETSERMAEARFRGLTEVKTRRDGTRDRRYKARRAVLEA